MRLTPILIAPLVAVAACVPAPRSTPAPVVAPPPVTQAPAPTPLSTDWRDWPLTSGTWYYRSAPSGSTAVFGISADVPIVSFRCDAPSRRITIVAQRAPELPLTIRTSTALRSLPFAGGQTVLAATDPLFEAIGFSRGRFVIEQAGSPPLVLPAWAEIERVTEDCRG